MLYEFGPAPDPLADFVLFFAALFGLWAAVVALDLVGLAVASVGRRLFFRHQDPPER